LFLDPEVTPKYFSGLLVGKSHSLFSLSELFKMPKNSSSARFIAAGATLQGYGCAHG